MATKADIRRDIDQALADLEQLSDEIRVKLHLAEMDARDAWEKTLSPRVEDARRHASEATAASKAALDATVKAMKEFAQNIV